MKILLDENFPFALYRGLKADGGDVDHIITLGWRGAPDQRIRERLFDREVLFLTQDEDFLFDRPTEAIVVLSRVRQSRRLAERVEVWRHAILDLTENPRPERRFELMDDGYLLAWEQGHGSTWTAKLPRPQDRTPEVGSSTLLHSRLRSERVQTNESSEHRVPTGAGLVHHPFISPLNRLQVAEGRRGYGGSNKAFSVERDSVWKEQLLEPLPLFE